MHNESKLRWLDPVEYRRPLFPKFERIYLYSEYKYKQDLNLKCSAWKSFVLVCSTYSLIPSLLPMQVRIL